jgi:hypothetical protein
MLKIRRLLVNVFGLPNVHTDHIAGKQNVSYADFFWSAEETQIKLWMDSVHIQMSSNF